MENNGPFGFDPNEFDRVAREAGEGLRDAFGRLFANSPQGAGFGMLFDQFARPTPRSRPQPETAGEAGDGVWAIYLSGSDGKAHVEQVYRSELEALRANKLNTDPTRNVRFLPYGIDVSVLDAVSDDQVSDNPASEDPAPEAVES